jgi:hypothetical protein
MIENILNHINSKNKKVTIILGSGYHKEALGNFSVLSNWDVLLSKLQNNKLFSKKHTLDFEQIIINQTKQQDIKEKKQAHQIENNELKNIANFIREEQKWVLSQNNRFHYPTIFNPKYVSDVISLNFDYVAEELCNIHFGNGDKIEWLNESSFSEKYPKNSSSSVYQRTSFRKITDKDGNEIRFWYPHGSILRPQSITLGVNRYAKLVSDTIRIRNNYKKIERENLKSGIVDLTWYSQILKNPVFILGASVSEAEWDLLSAIVYKTRNFAKPENKHHENKIYKMFSTEEAKEHNFWFTPLFIDKNFEEQWRLLEIIFKRG